MKAITSIRWDHLLKNLSHEYPEVDVQRLDVRNVSGLRSRYPSIFPEGLKEGGLRAVQVPGDPNGAWMIERQDPPVSPTGEPVFLRTIARALERHLSSLEDCSIHWVAVLDEDSLSRPPTRAWVYDDYMLQFSFTQGNSEGMLIYVHAQADRYRPGDLVPLLRIKMLCGASRVFDELRRVHSWFESDAFTALVSGKQPVPA